ADRVPTAGPDRAVQRVGRRGRVQPLRRPHGEDRLVLHVPRLRDQYGLLVVVMRRDRVTEWARPAYADRAYLCDLSVVAPAGVAVHTALYCRVCAFAQTKLAPPGHRSSGNTYGARPMPASRSGVFDPHRAWLDVLSADHANRRLLRPVRLVQQCD